MRPRSEEIEDLHGCKGELAPANRGAGKKCSCPSPNAYQQCLRYRGYLGVPGVLAVRSQALVPLRRSPESYGPVQESAGGLSKAFGGTTFGGREDSGIGKSSPLAFTMALFSSVKPISSSVR